MNKYPTPAEALAYAENTGRANVLPLGWVIQVTKGEIIQIRLFYGSNLMAVAYSTNLIQFRSGEKETCNSFDEAMGKIVHYAWEMVS